MEILLSCCTTSSPYLFFSNKVMLLVVVIPAALVTLVYVMMMMMMMKSKGSSRAGDKNIRPRPVIINHPPSPNLISTIKIIFKTRFFGLPHLFLGDFSKVYGPVMLLNLGRLPTLVISSAETAKEILKTQDLNFCSRPPLVSTRRITRNYKEVAVAPYSEYWREMRKIYVLKLLSTKSVQSFRSAREQEVSIMISSIISSSTTSHDDLIVNLDEKLLSLTVSIFFRIVFGSSHQGRTNGCKFEKVVYQVSETIGTLCAADLIPYIGWVIDVITGIRTRLEKDYHDLYFFLEQFINEYLDPNSRTNKHNKKNEAIVDILLELEGEQFGGGILTREHSKAVLVEIFFAGVNTTSVTMVWAMAELVRNPRIMKKVQDEVRSCVANKGKVEESDLDQLQYLKMVIKETLRLHPTAPLLIPRESISKCKIKGYDIWPKTMVLINVWKIGRDPESWENPDMFFPERFLDNNIDFMGHDFDFLPFGAGRRGCPGIGLGNVIMELTLANLLYCFNWELPTGLEKEDLDMEEEGSFSVHKKTSLRLMPIIYRWIKEKPNEESCPSKYLRWHI